MKLRRIGAAAVAALIFAEGDSASDSDSGGSDSGESSDVADSGLSVANVAQVSSSGDGTAMNQGSSGDSDSDSDSGNSSNRPGQHPPGQPGATGGMSVGDLRDIPLGGDDGPIKK